MLKIFFSDGGYNETTSNLLSLSTTSNLIEVWVNGAFKANINIKRMESNCGIYLKWFNANGGIHTGYLISFIQIQPVQKPLMKLLVNMTT
jgi:hypothetical protein